MSIAPAAFVHHNLMGHSWLEPQRRSIDQSAQHGQRASVLLWLIVLACLIGPPWSRPASAALPNGVSGLWYEPDRSGHGLSLTRIDPLHAVLLWHTFDPEGRPLTLYVDATIDGNELTGPAFAPQGLGFATADGGSLLLPPWGEVGVLVQSCTHAELTWRAFDPAYGQGNIQLRKLVHVAGLGCDDETFFHLQPDLYLGTSQRISLGLQIETDWIGVVDGQGSLWGYEVYGDDPLRSLTQGNWERDFIPQMLIARVEVDPEGPRLRAEARTQSALFPATAGGAQTTTPLLSGVDAGIEFAFADPAFGSQVWRRAPASLGLSVEAYPRIDEIAGRYRVGMTFQFFLDGLQATLDVNQDGSLCFDPELALIQPGAPQCAYTGQIRAIPGELSLLEFELQNRLIPTQAPIQGRAFVPSRGEERALVLIGASEQAGLAWVAQPCPPCDFP